MFESFGLGFRLFGLEDWSLTFQDDAWYDDWRIMTTLVVFKIHRSICIYIYIYIYIYIFCFITRVARRARSTN